ncbi:MAG: hypothetical protein JOZ48_22685 [Acidobacteriaceae bacterium]|nr:hypothetical protein [Acidobacteriaceae bacterium]
MPTFNSVPFFVPPGGMPQVAPQTLLINGPILQVQIEVPTALASVLQRDNQPIPAPIDGIGLIDTGASITSIDQSVFARLGVNPVGIVQVGTAGGQQQQSTFPAKFNFPGTGLPTIESSAALGCNLTGQVVMGNKAIIALIGRDLLANCVLVYNGTTGTFSLSF